MLNNLYASVASAASVFVISPSLSSSEQAIGIARKNRPSQRNDAPVCRHRPYVLLMKNGDIQSIDDPRKLVDKYDARLFPKDNLAIFQQLAALWHSETDYSSSVAVKVNHFAYRKIVEMGESAMPFILDDLKQSRSHWFTALREIAKVDPVPKEDRGNIEKMTEAWITWGRNHKIIG